MGSNPAAAGSKAGAKACDFWMLIGFEESSAETKNRFGCLTIGAN
jgi:hypothetical protein